MAGFFNKDSEMMDIKIKKVANEIIAHKGTMKLINDTEITGNGSHYVGDYLGWSIWVFVEGYHSMSPKKRTKYIYLTREDSEDYQISWTIRLGERFTKRDIRLFCLLRYED